MFVVRLAHFDAGNFRHGVRLVRRLQLTVEQVLFLDRLRSELGIDARAAEETELLYIVQVGRVNDVVLNLQIVEDEFGGICAVGMNPSDFCRR